jgi:hypothetical protein
MDVYDHHDDVKHVHHAAEDVVLSRILVPFELDQLLDSFGGKDFKLFCFVDKTHQIVFTVDESFLAMTVVINSILDILSDLWQNVNRVSDFIDLILVNILIVTIFVVENGGNVREYRLVIVSELEDSVVVTTHICFLVGMRTWPVVEIKRKTENVTFKKGCDSDSFLQKCGKNVVEEEAGDVIILEFDDIINDQVHGFHLVAFQSTVDGCSVIVFHLSL